MVRVLIFHFLLYSFKAGPLTGPGGGDKQALGILLSPPPSALGLEMRTQDHSCLVLELNSGSHVWTASAFTHQDIVLAPEKMFYYCFQDILPIPENMKIIEYKETSQYCIQHL